MKYINIDFNNKKNTIEEFESITLTVPKTKFLLGLVNKEIDIDYYLINVENIRVPHNIIINDLSQLIKLKVSDGKKGPYSNQLSNINIISEKTEIKIACDLAQIADYTSESEYKEVIQFDVVLYPDSNTEKFRKTYSLELIFIRCSSDLIIDFNMSDDIKYGIEHKKKNKVYLGDFNINTVSEYSFAEPIEWSEATVYNKKDDFNDDVFMGDEISLSNKNTIVSSLDKYELKLRRLLPYSSVNIPIFVDLSLDDSPLKDTKEYIYFKVQYSLMNKTFTKSHKFYYTLMPDTRSTKLMALIKHGDFFKKLTDFNILNSKCQWLGYESKGKYTCCTLRIGNYAESGDGKISINDFRFNFSYSDDSTSVIFDKNIDLVENISNTRAYEEVLKRVILVNEKTIDKLPNKIIYNNTKDSYTDFNVSFRHDAIMDIPHDISTIVLSISFKYKISDSDKLHEFDKKVIFKIERNLGDSWLALDFGTSASVAAFANGASLVRNRDTPNNLLINLQDGLRNLVNNYDKVDIAEKDTVFLSSEMMLRQGNNKNPVFIESTNYHDDIVYLSPIRDVYEQLLLVYITNG